MRYNIFTLILFLLVSYFASAQNDLDSYLKTAAQNNPGLKARFNEYLAALEVAPQVKALPDPQLAFGYFIQPVETREGPQQLKISASQMFPWFGTLKTKGNMAVAMAKAKYEAFREAKSMLYNDVRNTYYNLYFVEKAISVTDENLKILKSLKELALIKAEAGLVSVVDEYRIEMEINDMENQLALLKDKFYALRIMFNNILNVDNSSTVNIPQQLWDTEPVISKDAVRDSIMNQNHQLLGLGLESQAFKYKQDLVRLEGRPDFKIGIDYTIIGQGSNNMAGTDAVILPAVGITVPLYRNKYKSKLNEAVYRETASKEERLNRQNILETVFEQSWKDLSDARRRVILNKKQEDLARRSLKILETGYLTSNKNFEEVLRMERKMLSYRLELEKARADKQAAISFISYLMGE